MADLSSPPLGVAPTAVSSPPSAAPSPSNSNNNQKSAVPRGIIPAPPAGQPVPPGQLPSSPRMPVVPPDIMEAWNPVDFESGDLPPSSPYFHARLHGLLSSAQRFRDQMHPLIGIMASSPLCQPPSTPASLDAKARKFKHYGTVLDSVLHAHSRRRTAPLIENVVPDAPVIDFSLQDVAGALFRLETMGSDLAEAMREWEHSQQEVVSNTDQAFETVEEYLTARKEYLTKQKKYLGAKFTNQTMKSSQRAERDAKTAEKLLWIERTRCLLANQATRMELERELRLLKPLMAVLEGYQEYFRAGMATMQSIEKEMHTLREYMAASTRHVKELQEKTTTRQAEWEEILQQRIGGAGGRMLGYSSRRNNARASTRSGPLAQALRNISASSSNPNLAALAGHPGADFGPMDPAGSNGPGKLPSRPSRSDLRSSASKLAGIRDLQMRQHTNKATEKEGYLYYPAPHFCPVYCKIKDGVLTIRKVDVLGLRFDQPADRVQDSADSSGSSDSLSGSNSNSAANPGLERRLLGRQRLNSHHVDDGLHLRLVPAPDPNAFRNRRQNGSEEQDGSGSGGGSRGNSGSGGSGIGLGDIVGLSGNPKGPGTGPHPDLVSIPVQLCSVKETGRELKLRFCFTVISPVGRVVLQADTRWEFQDWLTVIQNAIGGALNQGEAAESEDSSGSGSVAAENLDEEMEEQKRLLWEIEGNEVCADCGAKNPDWLSLNLAILLCMECSGVHRSLGTHISKVRSATLDKLDRYTLAYMQVVGNYNSNSIWEAREPPPEIRIDSTSSREARTAFVRAKYVEKEFLAPERVSYSQAQLTQFLWMAVETDNPYEVLQAIVWGADLVWPNPAMDNRNALHHAVMYGNPVIVELILRSLPDVFDLGCGELRGWSALHYAAYQDDACLVDLLILRGGSSLAGKLDAQGKTALETALEHHVPLGDALGPDQVDEPECAPLLREAEVKHKKRLQRQQQWAQQQQQQP